MGDCLALCNERRPEVNDAPNQLLGQERLNSQGQNYCNVPSKMISLSMRRMQERSPTQSVRFGCRDRRELARKLSDR
jgi:hypothetical protein